MSFIQRFGVPVARSLQQFALPASKTYTQTTLVALRQFSSKDEGYPLHDAVREGSLKRVKEILLTDPSADVNGLNDKGELPLGIALEKYAVERGFSNEIPRLLHDWGACYLLDDGQDNAPLMRLRKADGKTSRLLRIHAAAHSVAGCGIPNSRCTNACKKETREYSPDLKAKVALESLTSELSVKELAEKHRVEDWEVIKWRSQARTALADLFKK
ncbi:MAG: transposase [Parachlamydiaceae bacterium]